MTVTIRRIHCGTADAARSTGGVAGTARPQRKFRLGARPGADREGLRRGAAAGPGRGAHLRGRANARPDALFHYTEQFDRVRLNADNLRVSSRQELAAAHAAAEPGLLETVRRVRQNVMAFQSGILHRNATLTRGRQARAAAALSAHAAGRRDACRAGRRPIPRRLLMTVCPAQAAGVPEIAVVMPPTPNGASNTDLLAVCHELGVTRGLPRRRRQAVAALGLRRRGIAGGGHDRRPGQHLRGAGEATRLRRRWPSTASPAPARSSCWPTTSASAGFRRRRPDRPGRARPGSEHPHHLARAAHGSAVEADPGTAIGGPAARRTGPREPGAIRRPGAGARHRGGGCVDQPTSARSTCRS